MAAAYRERLDAVTNFAELVRLGENLHETERAAGNVAVMAQLMAGAQHDPELAATARGCLDAWTGEIERCVRRVLSGGVLVDLFDPAALARAISAGFLGIELYEGVDPTGAANAFGLLENLGAVVTALDDLGPVGRRAVRAALRRMS